MFVCLVAVGSMQDPKIRKVKSAAKALSHASNKIPEAKLKELSLVVQEHFGVSSLTPEIISQAAVCNSVSHGFIVVERVSAEGKLSEFEKVWRKHFYDTMRPKFLPPLWSVDGPREEFKEKCRTVVFVVALLFCFVCLLRLGFLLVATYI